MICLQARRSLLANDTAQAAAAATGQLYNQASVTLQANCSSSDGVPATLSEMQTVLNNNLVAVSPQLTSSHLRAATLDVSHVYTKSARSAE